MTDMLALELRGLCKAYGGLQVTSDVHLGLATGARHALIGPNGAGKSTLVGLVSGAISPDSGQVLSFGHDLTHASLQGRVKMGLVRSFQITSLFPKLSVLENVQLAVNENTGVANRLWQSMQSLREQRERSLEILAELEIHEQADLPVENLSYGKQRLVEIAIVLALKPRVLLLDEPAAGIPSNETELLLSALHKLPSEMAILMIEHDMKLVRDFCADVTVLVSGKILASGNAEEVMNSATVRDVYLGRSGHDRFTGVKDHA
jgi:branched-chain amino acid transport system ATP-binding protein